MLYVWLGDQRAIDELTVSCSSGEDPAALEPRDNRSHGRLRQLTRGVQLLPDLCDGQLPLFPEEAEHRNLELGELLAIGHFSLLVSTRVDSTPVERIGQEAESETPAGPATRAYLVVCASS